VPKPKYPPSGQQALPVMVNPASVPDVQVDPVANRVVVEPAGAVVIIAPP
jgi:hypothetical protein